MNAPDPRSYDERQQDTVLRACRSCLRVYWMKPWRVRCLDCEDPWRPKVDVGGNLIDGP